MKKVVKCIGTEIMLLLLFEIVFTLENTSNSKTLWIDDDTNEKHEIITKNNSIIITQGNGAYHIVSPVTIVYRSIIKIVYDIL